MEKIKLKTKVLSLTPILVFVILSIMTWRYDKSVIGFSIALTIIMSLRTIYIAYFDGKQKTFGFFIDERGIILDQTKVYEWSSLKITKVDDHKIFGRQLTIVSGKNSFLEAIEISLILIDKKSFLTQLMKYAPRDNEVRILIEEYYNSKL